MATTRFYSEVADKPGPRFPTPMATRHGDRYPEAPLEAHAFAPWMDLQIVMAAATGAPKSLIADTLGISVRTLSNWLKEGWRDPEGRYGPMAAAYRRARGRAHLAYVQHVNSAQRTPALWAASMTMLERQRPEDFARKDLSKIQANITIKKGLEFPGLQTMSDTDLATFDRLLAKLETPPNRADVIDQYPALEAPKIVFDFSKKGPEGP